MVDARNPALEAQILADPEDPRAYLVYADWLHTTGDPRGELITVQAARATDPDSQTLASAEAERLQGVHRDELSWLSFEVELDWYCGFWRGIRFYNRRNSQPDGDRRYGAMNDELARLLACPSARFLRRAYCDSSQARHTHSMTPQVLEAFEPLACTLRDLRVKLRHFHQFADEDLLALALLAELRLLVLSSCETISPQGMSVLSSLRHLAVLRLDDCQLADEHARCLAGLPLTHVYFDSVTPGFTEAGMRVLAAAPLQTLVLDASTLDDAHLAALTDHPTLADLELHSSPSTWCGARISARGARALGSLPALRRLYIPRCSLDDRGVSELAPLGSRLRSLHLHGVSAISDGACETLSALEQLELLDISGTRVTGAGLRALARLRELRYLDLCGLSIDDAALRELVPLVNLHTLYLSSCRQLTDAVVDSLVQLPALKVLDLSGTAITDAGYTRLLIELPQVELTVSGMV